MPHTGGCRKPETRFLSKRFGRTYCLRGRMPAGQKSGKRHSGSFSLRLPSCRRKDGPGAEPGYKKTAHSPKARLLYCKAQEKRPCNLQKIRSFRDRKKRADTMAVRRTYHLPIPRRSNSDFRTGSSPDSASSQLPAFPVSQ